MSGGGVALLVGAPWGWAIASVWGAIWGSFFNVAIYRIGRVADEEQRFWEASSESGANGKWLDEERTHWRWVGKALASLTRPPRSACPACGALIRARDNVPLLSWLLLRGRCRDCHARIAIAYPAVELGAIALAAVVYLRFVALAPAPPLVAAGRFFVYFGFAGVLLVLSAIDLRHHLLPDAITVPATLGFFVAGRLLPDVNLLDATIGALGGWCTVTLLDLAWRLVRGRNALGGGDAKLLALVGALLGWRALPWTFFGAGILGALVTIPVLVLRRRKQVDNTPLGQTAIPFGPFLASAAVLYLFAGRAVEEYLFAG